MTTGVVLIANNTKEIKYVTLAKWSAKNIQRHLGLPVTLITSNKVAGDEFDKIIKVPKNKTQHTRYFTDYSRVVTWDNCSRHSAYRLSPYSRTLLLDVDYVVASDELQSIIDSPMDFVAFKDATDVTGTENFDELNAFGKMKIPMYWATVMCFNKSEQGEAIFEMMAMVEANYTHYANLYNFSSKPFRNDYALSIALNTLCGHTPGNIPEIPWQLKSSPPAATIEQIAPDEYRLRYKKKDKDKYLIVRNTDIHVMGKKSLLEIARGKK